MAGKTVLLDKLIQAQRPALTTAADQAAFESIPLLDRLAAHSTYEALRVGASYQPEAAAMNFLPNADPKDTPLVISHQQFFARVTQSANFFYSLGVGKDDVVSFLLPLVPQSFYTLFGAEAAGIANPVNPLLEPHQLAEIMQAAGTKVLVCLGPNPQSDIWQKVEKIRHELPGLKAIVQVGGGPTQATQDAASSQPIYQLEAMLDRFPADHLQSGRTIQPDETAAYFHTGGTTGTPKLVRHTHLNQVYQAWAVNLMLGGEPSRNMLFGLPLYHVGGALTQALALLAGGGCLVVLSAAGWRNPNAVRHIWGLVQSFKPPVLGGVPTVLAAVNAMPSDGFDTSSIKTISGGGSAIPVAVGKTLSERFNAPVLEVYGMTETASVHTISYMDRPVRLGSVGHAVPYSKVRVVKVDASGNDAGDCATNEIGVVVMAGPGVLSGYMNAVHNKGAFVAPGWVNSGDLGRLDDEGYLWITGRAKDLIIRGGHNIDPMPLEEILYQHPAVGLAALIGQPDAYAGELPLGYVQLKPGAHASSAELLNFLKERTPERAAVPVALHIIDTMPLTGVGKVFKPSLRWDATQRVFTKALEDIDKHGAQLEVQVGADGTHGTVAKVLVKGSLSAGQHAALEAAVHQALNPFTVRHEVVVA